MTAPVPATAGGATSVLIVAALARLAATSHLQAGARRPGPAVRGVA